MNGTPTRDRLTGTARGHGSRHATLASAHTVSDAAGILYHASILTDCPDRVR